MERGEARDVLKSDTRQFMSGGEIFFDRKYLVVQVDGEPDGDVAGFRSYALHPPKDGGATTVELRWTASFAIVDHVEAVYEQGRLAYTTAYGEIG